MSMLKKTVVGLSLVLTVVFVSNPVAAQAPNDVLQEITVTAQKREQSITDVAVSVAVMSGDQIIEQGFNDLQEISTFMPGLLIEESDVIGTTLSIRGINNGGPNVGFEQAAVVFSDGIYNGRSMQSIAGIYDISQVEVLFGPQPIYFGQSAIAGLVSYKSTRPTDVLSGYLVAEYGTFNSAKLEGAIGGPIGEGWGIRVAGKYTESDGWTDVLATGEDGNASEDTALRLSLAGDFSDTLSMFLKTEVFEQETSGAPFPTLTCNPDLGAQIPIDINGDMRPDFRSPVGVCQLVDPTLVSYGYNDIVNKGGSISARTLPGPRGASALDMTRLDIAGNDALGLDVDGSNSVLEFNWDVGQDLTITSTTGFSDYESSTIEDFDASPLAVIMIENSEEFEMFSQELRIQSNRDAGFNWMFGAYYQDQELDYLNRVFAAVQTQFGPPGSHVSGDFHEDATYLGAFASVSYDVSDKLSLDLGVRWSDVEKSAYLMESASSVIVDPATSVVTGYSDVDDTQLRPGGRCLGNTPTGLDCAATVVARHGQAALDGMGGDTSLELDDSDVNFQVSATYDLTDSVSMFGRYVNGFKAGGFSRGGTSFFVATKGAFDAETADSYELGMRFLGDNVFANVTIFNTKYEDRQVEAGFVDPGTNQRSLIFINAAEATIQGLEADIVYKSDLGTRLRAALSYIDSEYDSFTNAGCLPIENGAPLLGLPTMPGGPPGTPLPGSPDCVNQNIDLSGTSFDGISDWNLTLGIAHTFDISSSYALTLGADASVFDDFDDSRGQPQQFSYDFRDQDGFTLLNLRAALQSIDGGWEIAAYGRNVTDEEYWLTQPTAENPFGTTTAAYSRPASYGIQFRYDF